MNLYFQNAPKTERPRYQPPPVQNSLDQEEQNHSGFSGQVFKQLAEDQPARVNPYETKPFTVEPYEVKPFEGEAYEVKPFEAKPFEVQPADVNTAEVKPFEAKPIELKPFEAVDEMTTEQLEDGQSLESSEVKYRAQNRKITVAETENDDVSSQVKQTLV